MDAYKKAWHFMKHFKLRMILLVICMILVSFLAALSPFIISKIIDDNIFGVTQPWVEVETEDSDTVIYNSSIYKLEKDIDNNDIVVGNLTLLMDDTYFYAIEGDVVITENQERVISEDVITIDGTEYPSQQLSSEEVQIFYSPFTKSIIILVIALLFTLLLKSLFGYMQRMISAMITVEATRNVRLETMDKLQYVPLEFLESEPAGKTTNRIMSDTSGVSDIYTTSLNIVFSSISQIFFAYVFMFLFNPRVATYCLLLIPIILLWTWFFSTQIHKIATKTQETNSRMIGSINEIINGIGILKIFNRDRETIEDFAKLNDQYVDEAMGEVKMHITAGWNGINLFQGVVGALILFYFGYQNLQYDILVPAGVIYAYYNYIILIISPIGQLFHSIGNIENSKVKVNRIFTLLNQELEENTIEEDVKYNGNIIFDNVSFSYDQKRMVLKNINLEIKPGEKVGLVGHTGSGKSTMMNLLMRFNDLKGVDKGKILIDKRDINSMTKRTYRQDIGIILQEPILFSGSIYENICYSKDVTVEEATQMLIRVGGQKLLDKLDNGIMSDVSRRGNNLSLGEKQLISFARILVSDPSIIVMDEATANIDTETEEMINFGMQEVSIGRTLIVIAHRLSTIVDSNQILVLQNGEIIERGNHNNLLEMNGYYSNMYRSQVN